MLPATCLHSVCSPTPADCVPLVHQATHSVQSLSATGAPHKWMSAPYGCAYWYVDVTDGRANLAMMPGLFCNTLHALAICSSPLGNAKYMHCICTCSQPGGRLKAHTRFQYQILLPTFMQVSKPRPYREHCRNQVLGHSSNYNIHCLHHLH